MIRIITALLILLTGISIETYSQISISTARTLPVGTSVTIAGIVTNGAELGVIRYLQDGTAGIAAYSSSMSSVKRSDSIVVTGVIKDYNGLLELDPVTSFTVISTGHNMPANQLITPSMMGENYESELVLINNVSFTTNPGGTFSSNQTYSFTSGGENGQIYVRAGHPLIGSIIPSTQVGLVGICSQHYANFQLLCRDTNDIIKSGSIYLTSPVLADNINTGGLDIKWTTNIAGSSEIFYGNTPTLELGHMSGLGNTSSHTVSITGASPSELFYVKAFSVNGADTAFGLTSVFITQSLSSGDIKVYFTCEVDTSVAAGQYAIQLDNAVDDTIIAYINRAKYSIDIAIYNFGTQGISNIATALNAAYNSGIDIRIVYDGNSTNAAISSLNVGIGRLSSPTGANWGIMHNKFMIIDAHSSDHNDPIVWTGATNWTSTNINSDANNVVIIQDKSLSIAYTLEFNEMYGSEGLNPDASAAKFGADKTNNTPNQFIIGGNRVECYFSPSDGTNDQIIKAVNSADYDIEVFTMLITRSDIAYALRDKAFAGKDVKVMVNSEGECTPLVISTLQSVLTNNFKTYGESYTLHSKYMIVDHSDSGSEPLVLTGSHNWSNSANNSNDENTLIIYSAEIANLFYQDFHQHFVKGVVVAPQGTEDDIANNVQKMTVYPNPATDNITISFNNEVNSEVWITITDMLGQKISENKIEKNNKSLSMTLNNISKGIYIINTTAQGYRPVKLIIR